MEPVEKMSYLVDLFGIEITIVIITAFVSLLSSVISLCLSQILERLKLSYSERLSIKHRALEEKYDGIVAIRREIAKLREYERLDLIDDNIIDEYKDCRVLIPSVFISYKSLVEYSRAINNVIGEYRHCLNDTCYLHVLMFSNYLFNLCIELKDLNVSDDLIRWSSVVLYEDFNKIESTINSQIVRMMNSPALKFYDHSGYVYKRKLNKYSELMMNSQLYKKTFERNGMIDIIKRSMEH